MNAVLSAAIITANPTAGVPYPPTPQSSSSSISLSDFHWLRGRYLTSGPERTEWQRRIRSAESSVRERTAMAQQAVRTRGFNLVYRGDGCFGDEACERIMRGERVARQFSSWDEFESAWREAMPLVRGYLAAVRQGESQVKILAGSGVVDKELKARFLRDQMLRAAPSEDLRLTPSGLAVFQLIMSLHTSRTDKENTEWLRRLIITSGWPTPPEVTSEGADAAWFMVVHARHDPAFRLDAVQKAAEDGNVRRANLATKIDHILSETTGSQRYGTKGDCVNGKFVLVASEKPEALPQLRREVGLPTLEEQSAMMQSACSC